MSTLATTNIKHASSSSNNIILNSDGSTSISGHIIQVVEGSTSSRVSSSVGTWTATNLTASITPASSSNKVYVSACTTLWQNILDNVAYVTIFRSTDGGSNWTNLGHDDGSNAGQGWSYIYASSHRINAIQTLTILDTPSSTSAVQYKVYIRAFNNSGECYLPAQANETNRIHLMEVAA